MEVLASVNQIVAALVFSAATLTGATATQPAPDFDVKTAVPSVAVAISVPGDSYPAPEECLRDDVICMRYPLWFQAKPIQPVYGAPPKEPVEVTTYTHYGQPESDDKETPRIMLLAEEGGRFMMPVYASERVWRRTDGQYYLLVDTPDPVHWLPCSVEGLRERVDLRRFSAKARLALDDLSVKQYPELFVRHKRYAVPRFGISVDRLGEHLRKLKLSAQDFQCIHNDES